MSKSIWVTADKRKIRVGAMNTSHLRNTIAKLERDVPKYLLDAERNALPIYHEMVAELKRREQPRKLLFSNGLEYQLKDGRFYTSHPGTTTIWPSALKLTDTLQLTVNNGWCDADILKILDLIRNSTETAEVDA
jgi:hypothetical protein